MQAKAPETKPFGKEFNGNPEIVKKAGCQEIFVITKLYPNQYSDPEAAIEEALAKLDIDYIDMMLLHHPGAGDVKAYLAMEKAVADGKVRSLGLSNWYVEELEEFLPQINITPAFSLMILMMLRISLIHQASSVNHFHCHEQ